MNDFKSLGTQPISDAQPCGVDVRDDSDYDLLQNEISKLTNPAASGSPDWEQVVRLSQTLLANKGKDILVASYLVGGLLITRGLPGLADGAQMLEGLLATHWEQLYPPVARMRARRNAIQWLIDRVRAHADEHDWSSWPPQDAALVDGLREALGGIDRVLAEKDGDAPSMQPLRALIGTVQVAEAEPAIAPAPEPAPAPAPDAAPVPAPAPRAEAPPAPPPAATPAAPAAQAFAPAALAPLSLDTSGSASHATDEALERLVAVAGWYAQNEPSNALGFRLRRMGVWAAIERAPVANGSDTQLPGPIPQLQDALRNLQARAAHADIVGFTETQVVTYPFWLDLNHAAATSLALLGDAFSAARREVCGETGKFVARINGLERLKFANGVPFANADTVQWLASLASSGTDAAAAAPDPLAAVMSRARALAADNDLRAAAQCLQDAIDKSSAVAVRLKLRTAMCDLLLEHRPGAPLDAFARALVDEVDRYGVASWDPELSADALRAAYAILSRNDRNDAETAALLARIAPLDMSIAVRLIT